AAAAPGRGTTHDTCPAVTGNGELVALEAGVYDCNLTVAGNNNRVRGAGASATTLKGNLSVAGNGNTVSELAVEGAAKVYGNNNDVTGVEFRGTVDVAGNNNKR
ncbi:MAG: hypothetical protein JRI23_03585, partial [Deltaproteobacteria bacterium]|nr:hypothetical protein [Deltaproteobacteria bacterium]MBW2530598.1 hypothetical protein [Deltaproteobacteria bacterium]